MVWDSVKDASREMVVETLSVPDTSRSCELMHADSRYVFGLQLADLIAYSFNRQFRIKDRAMKGNVNEMDDAILDGLISLKDRFVDVLELPDSPR